MERLSDIQKRHLLVQVQRQCLTINLFDIVSLIDKYENLKIEEINSYFNCINDNIFNYLQNISKKYYFDLWICTELFFRKCLKKKSSLKYLNHS